MLPLYHRRPYQRPLQPVPVRNEAEMVSELRRVGEFFLAISFSILGTLVNARRNAGGPSTPHQLYLLDFSLLAIVLCLAISALHLELHRQLGLPMAHLYQSLAAFCTTAAVILLIASTISPSLWWALFAVFFSTLLFRVCFKLPAMPLHYVAALRRCRFVVFLIGPAADDVVQSPSNQLSPTPTDEQQGHQGESGIAAPAELQLSYSGMMGEENQPRSTGYVMFDVESFVRLGMQTHDSNTNIFMYFIPAVP